MALPTPTIVGQGRVESELIFTWNGKGDGQRHNFQAGNSSLILTLNTGNEYDIEAYKITATMMISTISCQPNCTAPDVNGKKNSNIYVFPYMRTFSIDCISSQISFISF